MKVIFSKDIDERSDNDLQMCMPFLQNLSFLDKSLDKFPPQTRSKHKARILEKLIQNLIYEKVEADHVIFRFGDHGNKFYIVIEGEVAIMVPRSKEQILRLASRIEEGERNDFADDDEALSFFERVEKIGHTCFSGPIPVYEIKRRLGNLCTFGEVALTYSGMRTATVCTTVETHLISLDKKTYLEILESSTDDVIRFLKFLSRCFEGLNKFSLVNLMCLAEEFTMRMNSKLFEIGTRPDFCYIVKKGSVRVTRKQIPPKVKENERKKQSMISLLDRTANRTIKKNLDVSLLTEGAVIGFREIVEKVDFEEDGVIAIDQSVLYRIKARVKLASQ